MMMIRVTDHTLRAALLMHLIEQLERGDLAVLLEKGACPQCMDQLRALSSSDVLQLASSGHPDIHFSIDENGFDLGIASLYRRKEETAQLFGFIQGGASQSMLSQLFPTTDKRVIATYRKLLKSDHGVGRTALPDEEIRDLIHKSWHAINEEYPNTTSLREQLLLLHGFYNIFSLDVLYATINEFNQVEGKTHDKG